MYIIVGKKQLSSSPGLGIWFIRIGKGGRKKNLQFSTSLFFDLPLYLVCFPPIVYSIGKGFLVLNCIVYIPFRNILTKQFKDKRNTTKSNFKMLQLEVVKGKIKACKSEEEVQSLKFTEKNLINKVLDYITHVTQK